MPAAEPIPEIDAPVLGETRTTSDGRATTTGLTPPKDLLARMITQRVWLYARRRKAWLDTLSREPSEPEASDFFTDPDHPDREAEWSRVDRGQIWEGPIHDLDTTLAGPVGRQVHDLRDIFALSTAEVDLVQTCLAHGLDPTLGPVFAFFHGQNHAGYVSGPLVKRLFRHSTNAFWHPLGNASRWGLVRTRDTAPGEPPAIEVDPILTPWMEGRLVLDPSLARCVRPIAQELQVDGWPLDDAVRILTRIARQTTPVRLVVTAPRGSGRAAFAATAVAKLGMETIAIDTGAIPDEEWADSFLRILRFALLGRFAIIWSGSRLDRPWPRGLEAALLHVILSEPEQDVAIEGWDDCHIQLPRPSLSDKESLWEQACRHFRNWSESDQAVLTQCYELSASQIANIGHLNPNTGREAILHAREITRQHIGNLGQFLPCPFTWDDMILSHDLRAGLQDLAFEARTRARFWDRPQTRRLFPRGTGLTALLSGTPGTGKTMAAQVIAAELNLDLFRIDLARVVSKYIGETAKHLSEIFARASQMSAILLFDEADALFAKRTQVKDAHDRYANADTSYLLQLLEEFQGLALLTTNKRGNIDPAFYRRLRYVYEFPKPGPAERLIIWQRLTEEMFGETTRSRLESAEQKLAEQMPISPAQIKATLLGSAFIASRQERDLQPSDLLRALEREMAKEGRGLDGSFRTHMEQS